MSKRDLHNMYAQAQGNAAPESKCRYIRQILTSHATCVMQHFQHPKNLPITIYCIASLYNDGCCLWL